MRTSVVTLLLTLLIVSFSSIAAQTNTKNTQVKLNTDLGEIIIELYDDKAPLTVKNFLTYVNERFYDGTIFHRVVPDFVVQGGGFTFDFVKKPTRAPIKNEANNGLKNTRGSLSMARLNDPDSASSQFFINLVNNTNLNPQKDRAGYAVFGRVIEGMNVVDQITKQPRGLYRAHPEAPNVPIRILKATQLQQP